ncbi:MAG: HAD-IIIA family hydrolase [Deltaproteobacteria bacterium]|nr:HAD-IIIA family hydrolase [Deltaproteobacteria bacterium]MCK5709617.1 HAD-IIIA family hydrolase [Deltaproteobacteria bacterium]
MGSKAVFLDRDKTILLPKGGEKYIYRAEDFHISDKYIRALKELVDYECLLFVITNQGRIARGHLTEDDVEELHEYLDLILKQNGVHISEFEYCPHNPRGTLHPYNIICECRKPKTGMIDSIRNSYDIDIPNSWMIGDSYIDMIAGKKSGLRTIQVLTGSETSSEYADFIETDLVKAASRILTKTQSL